MDGELGRGGGPYCLIFLLFSDSDSRFRDEMARMRGVSSQWVLSCRERMRKCLYMCLEWRDGWG